ncbi:hypothetical protein J2Z18_006223 [Paenibacillus lactis]|uniref:Uncharacterized protein n=1 Tax=Paenibacillus lactis TaxID=228574 RepID=A0ABS4FLD0_9BACL|nr:hypothetical protein [Paenibacillus lactis]
MFLAFEPMLTKSELIARFLIFGVIPLFFITVRFIGNALMTRRNKK